MFSPESVLGFVAWFSMAGALYGLLSLAVHVAKITLPILLLRESLRLTHWPNGMILNQFSIWLLVRWTSYSALLIACLRQCMVQDSETSLGAQLIVTLEASLFFAGLLASAMIITMLHAIAKRSTEAAVGVLGMGLAAVLLSMILNQGSLFIEVVIFQIFWLGTLFCGLKILLVWADVNFVEKADMKSPREKTQNSLRL